MDRPTIRIKYFVSKAKYKRRKHVLGCRVHGCHRWTVMSLCMSHWLQAKSYSPEWKERHMIRTYSSASWGFLSFWFLCILFCLGVNMTFLYMLWKLGWAAISWLSAH
jgi:hypothetical protein